MKVLIISHNVISTTNNMGKTLYSLFSEFQKEELCQLYIYPTIPDIDFCDSYYRVTDKDILKSYFKFCVKGRKINKTEIDPERHSMFENPDDEAKYRNRKNKTALRMILRDLLWCFARWYNKSLKNWVKTQKPTCIFVAPGDAKFIYNMALKISKDFNIPIVTYVCDEYYFVKKPDDVLGKIRVASLKKKIKQLMSKTSRIITISKSLKELYSKEFSLPATVIMTGTSYPLQEFPQIKDIPQSITYMGNIRCNRFKSLIEIGNALKEINEQNNTCFSLNIYTAEKDESILNLFRDIDTIKLCGYVSGAEFDRVLHSADILLHTESFDEESVDSVKNSVSTKIADSLASGICLFAYGPSQVASMRHLIDNGCAIAATSGDTLKETLEKAFCDAELRKRVCQNAIKTANEFHNSEQNSKTLYSLLEKVNEGITD